MTNNQALEWVGIWCDIENWFVNQFMFTPCEPEQCWNLDHEVRSYPEMFRGVND